ncbi:MAG: F0F1 ATP synthase subunit A [Candidatus Cryptobacteroides sp.]|nr:F0F1 ATP synthase subunit A [Candidatus Cryptobacteroides sp.]
MGLLLLPSGRCRAEESASEGIDVGEILFGHTGDSYGWHILTWKGKHINLPLPCIVHSSKGWQFFLSSALEHGNSYEGLFIAEEGKYKDKIVELSPDGTQVRPLDLSVTKNVCSLMISSLILLLLVLLTARWYRKHDVDSEAPSGIAKLMEPLIVSINDSLVKENIGKDYRRYSPYLLTAFFFILINNLLGLVPFFPGGANVTGNIAVTLVLALCTFVAVNLFGNKHYWKDILWPDVPLFLKFPIPLMQLIEIFGLFTKPISLMVRLFANILAGHAMILGLVCVIFIAARIGPLIGGSMTVVTVLFGVFMNCLELLVAFIQAYVFTMLSAVFIGMSREG